VDAVRFGRRARHIFALAGLVAIIGTASVPVAAYAAETPVVAVQSNAQALPAGPQGIARTGPGFNEHREVRNNEENIDVNVCSTDVGPFEARCNARIRTDAHARTSKPARAGQAHPAGVLGNSGAYDPSYLESAYNLMSLINGGAGAGQVVAVVDAYDDPNVTSDLNYYRSYFGLPTLPTCTSWPSTTACFNKVNQTGAAGPYPTADTGWSQEIMLDVDMVSAICPNCSIVLVEANTNNYGDLLAGVNEAAALGANVISNSYGSGEWSGESSFDSAFNHPGVAITVSSGDAGYGTEWPAASPYVTAVGGTSLTQATNTGLRNGSETAWSSAGSGCSAYETKPTWQTDSGCANRTVADVSAVADPSTGVWIYDSYASGGFAIFGGTSAASPIVGSIYALAGNSRSSGVQLNADPYSHTGALFDVLSGSNGNCGGSYLCTSIAGFDGPTGLGSPNGTTAFTTGAVAPAAGFSLAANNTTLKLPRGTSVTDTLTLSAINGYHSSVQLSVTGLPFRVTASFNPSTVTPSASSILTLHASSTARIGTYTLKVTARGSDGTVHTQSLQLTVQ
jgi:subtilase family serine protease